MKILYCPVCGHDVNIAMGKCVKCNTDVPPVESKYDREYYFEKADGRYYRHVLFEEEIMNNPHFDMDAYKESQRITSENVKKMQERERAKYLPKCPTCSSTNIKQISFTKRAVHSVAFGIFSKTARSQFQCGNCGYKW